MADTSDILTGLGTGLANSMALGATTAYNQSYLNKSYSDAVNVLQQFAGSVAAQQNPDLLSEINQNLELAQQGTITPAQMLSAVQQKSNMLGVQVPQNFTDSVNSALSQEAQVAQQGYTPVERAAIQSALNGVIGQQQGEEAAIAANQQARGQYGGGQQIDMEQNALQGEINNASNTANQTEANAYQRALTAMTNEGQLGLSAGEQSFSQNAATATAQDAINSLNTQLKQQASAQNASANQAAILQTSAQQQARALANQQTGLALNSQNEGAANQTVQNLQGQENIEGGALANAGKNASNLLSPTYANSQAGVAGIAGNVLGPSSGVAGAVTGAIKGLTGSGSATPAQQATIDSAASNNVDTTNLDNSVNNSMSDFDSNIATDNSNLLSNLGSGGGDDGLGDLGFSTGGNVHGPGTETSDSIPVRLSNHEFVVNAESAKKHKPLLEAINNDDDDGILNHLIAHVVGPEEDDETVVVTPKGKTIDGQKALSDALRAMARVS